MKNKHESHHANNEKKMDNDVSPERLPRSPTKINHGLNEPSTSANFSFKSQVNDVKMSMSSYVDDTDSEEDQISSESEDEIIEYMEQAADEMKKCVELNKTVEDKESSQWVCLYLHKYLFVTSIRSYDNQWKIK